MTCVKSASTSSCVSVVVDATDGRECEAPVSPATFTGIDLTCIDSTDVSFLIDMIFVTIVGR